MIKYITACLLRVVKQGVETEYRWFGKQAGQWGQRGTEPRGERSQLSGGALNENGWAV